MRMLDKLLTRFIVGAVALVFGSALIAPPALAQTAPSSSLIVVSDFVLGGAGLAPGTPSCVQASRYEQGSAVVIRTRVIDGATGQVLGPSELSGIQVTIDGAIVLDERYGNHPGGGGPPTDQFWTAAWLIPGDYPTGSVDVAITATAVDGRTADWIPFNVAASNLTVIASATPAAS